MKKHLLVLTLILLASAGMCFAQLGNTGSKKEKKSDLTAKVPIDKKVRMGKLDNGITYYLRSNKKPEGRIQFRLAVNAGSVMEDEDQRGLAHFCEHMAFNGTEYYPHNELISKLQEKGVQFGGHVNAWTSFDETVYYVNMPNDDEMIEMGIKILDGWASKLLMDANEIVLFVRSGVVASALRTVCRKSTGLSCSRARAMLTASPSDWRALS